jgi:hypothetical protein
MSDMYPVYVLLTHSGTVLANAIKSVTKNPYSHSSISFDSGLENMYSFGRKYKNNPLIGVFVKESIKAGLYEDVADSATYSLYATFVTKEEKELMEQKLQYFKDNHDRFKYDFTGLILHQFGHISERDDAYFCSGFVTTILSSGKEYFDRHYSLVKPYDFAKHKDFHFVAKGTLKNYDPHKIELITNNLKNNTSIATENVVYFGLTQDEVDKGFIDYKSKQFTHKGVNLNLSGLKRFIQDQHLENDVKYYTTIPMNKFIVDKDIDPDDEYDMISVKLPFNIHIKSVKKL